MFFKINSNKTHVKTNFYNNIFILKFISILKKKNSQKQSKLFMVNN